MSSASGRSQNGPVELAVEVRVERVEDLFVAFDPSPVPQRSVSPDVVSYIEERVTLQAPGRGSAGPIRVRIHLPSDEQSACDDVQHAFQRHFVREAERRRQALADHFRAAWRLFFVCLGLAIGLVLLAQWIAGLSDSLFVERVANAVSIVIWVMVWRPTEMLLHDWQPLREDLHRYLRLAKLEVICLVAGRPSTASPNRGSGKESAYES